MSSDINRVLSFWFTTLNPNEMPTNRDEWWQKKPEFDEYIKSEFQDLYTQAIKGELDHWQTTPLACVALILVLDQFPRNMFRDQPKSFASDPQARKVTRFALKMGYHQILPLPLQVFLYIPLMHSENIEDQQASLKLFEALGNEQYANSAFRHHMIIEKFGRFPHRNKILRRESTEEELAFLKTPNSRF